LTNGHGKIVVKNSDQWSWGPGVLDPWLHQARSEKNALSWCREYHGHD